MMIKICGITRREDAEAATAAGATALGFVFVPSSPRYVTPVRAAELGAGLAPWKVGIFVNETPASIAEAMRAANLDIAQIYGGEAPQGARVWKAVRVTPEAPVPDLTLEGAEALLLDGPANGIQFAWSQAPQGLKIVLAGGLNPENVEEAIRTVQPWGVDVSSGLESAPGIKDHQKVRRFVENARKAAL